MRIISMVSMAHGPAPPKRLPNLWPAGRLAGWQHERKSLAKQVTSRRPANLSAGRMDQRTTRRMAERPARALSSAELGGKSAAATASSRLAGWAVVWSPPLTNKAKARKSAACE